MAVFRIIIYFERFITTGNIFVILIAPTGNSISHKIVAQKNWKENYSSNSKLIHKSNKHHNGFCSKTGNSPVIWISFLGLLWKLIETFWEILGTFWEVSETLWELLGKFWKLLGTLWELFRFLLKLFGKLWELFGTLWKLLVTLWNSLELFWNSFGTPSNSF